MDKKDFFIVLVLWLSAIYLWSLPIQNNPLPYGEVDAAAHYSIGAYMAYSDHSFVKLPNFLYRYRLDNRLSEGTLWYPPQFHSNLAIMEVLDSGSSVLVYVFLALISTSCVLTSYILIRNLYGFLAGFLSSFLLIFSVRGYIGYLWGQWPQVVALTIIPLILYFYYKYVNSFVGESGQKSVYLYMVSILIASQFLIHPMGVFHSLVALMVYTVLFFLKERKFPFNLKHFSIFALIFLVITSGFAPLQFGSVVLTFTGGGTGNGIGIYNPERLFYWFKAPSEETGYPAFYFSYSYIYGWWIILFIFLGVVILLVRRSASDLLLISWLVSIYVLIHLDVVGLGNSIFRSLAGESYIFYCLTAIAVVYLPNLLSSIFKSLKPYNKIMRYSFVFLFVLIILFTSAKLTYNQFNGAYAGLSRLTPAQYDAAIWLRNNLDENYNMTDMGTLNLAKKRWIQSVSFRHVVDDWENTTSTYFLVDYSDIILLGDRQNFEKLQENESRMANNSLVYNKGNVKVYKIEG
jgi:hypothetical protein